MATRNWWVVVLQNEQNSNTVPNDAQIISTVPGSSDDNTLFGNGGPVHGKYWRYMGPFKSQTEAKAAKPGPATIVPGVTVSPSGKVSGPGSTIFNGINAVGDFFNKLSEANTWLRIAEGLLGGILIAVSLAKLTGVENVISKAVTKIPVV
jgi:hypothetical protein